jgi:RND family efflux transporter MFP subunit
LIQTEQEAIMKTKTRHLHVIFGFIFLGAALTLWMWPQQQQASTFREHITTVGVDKVEKITTRRMIRFSGVTRAVQRAVMAFSIPGRLVNRPVEVGSRVKEGLELAGIDVWEYRNMVNMARATVAELNVRASQAARDRQRIQKLANVQAATAEELEQITAAADAVNASLSAASAQLDEAERVLNEATLKAPFAGTVTAVFLEPGEYASPGKAVVELSGDGDIELQVEVPENMVMTPAKGQSVRVILPMAGGKQVAGRVKSVARAAAAAGRLFPVVATLEPVPGLSAGMTAELVLEVETEGELTVPVKSVLNPGSSRPYVFCLDGEVVRRVAVALSSFSGDRIVVRGNLSRGDRVVVSGHTMLRDGERVRVAL